MNKTNQLEAQLQSWTPRPPSEIIRLRLFRRTFERRRWPALLAYATPAFGCVAMFLALCSAAHAPWQNASGHSPAFAFVSSNLVDAFASQQPRNADINLEWNTWEKTTFEWTNGHLSPSSNRSLQLAQTNLLQ